MGFTIDDMIVMGRDRYQMKLLAGKRGSANSISWVLLTEDFKILERFTGKELVVTTGLGFDSEEKLLTLARNLIACHASGLILNDGCYILNIPDSLISLCEENGFPLISVPWSVYLSELIKDISIRVFLQGAADEQLSHALIAAIEHPLTKDYEKDLLPYFDINGVFQAVLISTGDLEAMDSMDRRRIAYRVQLYLENISHNGSFFYYDSSFVLVVNAVPAVDFEAILDNFVRKVQNRLSDHPVYIGVGSRLKGIENLSVSYTRAKAALKKGLLEKQPVTHFDDMGIERLLYSVNDKMLLISMSEEPLRPILEYDEKHQTDYLETLERYLSSNGSIQAVSEAMYTHRNTIIYRINNIKKLLNCRLETPAERLPYQLACMLRKMHPEK